MGKRVMGEKTTCGRKLPSVSAEETPVECGSEKALQGECPRSLFGNKKDRTLSNNLVLALTEKEN